MICHLDLGVLGIDASYFYIWNLDPHASSGMIRGALDCAICDVFHPSLHLDDLPTLTALRLRDVPPGASPVSHALDPWTLICASFVPPFSSTLRENCTCRGRSSSERLMMKFGNSLAANVTRKFGAVVALGWHNGLAWMRTGRYSVGEPVTRSTTRACTVCTYSCRGLF